MTQYRVSYSAAQLWRECPQKYEYVYLRNIQPKTQAVPLTLGSLLHKYLESYYNGIKDRSEQYKEAHELALEVLSEDAKQCDMLGNALVMADAPELAEEMFALPARARRLCDRYYITVGMVDALSYDILHVEQWLEQPLLTMRTGDTIITPMKIDLVVRDRFDGAVELWDHKSTGRIPSIGHHLRDLQLSVYNVALQEHFGLEVSRLVWNYINTNEPTVPRVLKNGSLSRDKSIQTTEEVYLSTIIDLGLDPNDYDDMLDMLRPREHDVYFPRVSVPISLRNETPLLQDFMLTAVQMVEAHKDIESGRSHARTAIRHIARHCDWCAFNAICTADLTDGDGQYVIDTEFNLKGAKLPVSKLYEGSLFDGDS